MNQCILRTKKVKTKIQITASAEHNFRIRLQQNIDPTRTPQNKILLNSLEVDTRKATDLQQKILGHYDSLGVKVRADNVLAM